MHFIPWMLLDPSHIIAINSENDPKTGRTDSPKLLVERRPPQNGRKDREAVKNKTPSETNHIQEGHHKQRRKRNRPHTKHLRHGVTALGR